MLKIIFTILSIFSCSHLFANETPPSEFAGKEIMNGYKLKDYADFEKKWHFVTVRYRKDTGEMRLTFANDSAWKTLQSGSIDYPDGAAFGKVGIATQEDPAFTSSAVPSGARRYQLMIRDKRKHKDTDGWGYALFNEKGLTFPEDPQVQVRACAACHKIVPDRGFVFSQKMALSILEKHPKNIFNGPSRIKFKSIKRSQAPALMLNLLASSDKEIDIVAGKLADNIFQGALDEIRPILSERTWAKKRPAALLSPDGKKFSVTILSANGSLCGDKPEMTSYMTTLDEKEPVRKLTFCYEKSK